MLFGTLLSLVATRSETRHYDLAVAQAVTPIPTQSPDYGISGAAWDVASGETHVSVAVTDSKGHTVPVVLEFVRPRDPLDVTNAHPRAGPYCAPQNVALPTGTTRVIAHLGPHKDAACIGPGTSGTVVATFYEP